MRRVIASLAVATLAACGGDSTAPAPSFPSVVGVYTITGNFSGVSSPFQGAITFVQPSREQPTLDGSCAITTFIGGSTFNFSTISAASVSQSGQIGFNVGSASGSTTWRFTGTLVGNVITGTHTLAGGTSSYTGTFTMTKQ